MNFFPSSCGAACMSLNHLLAPLLSRSSCVLLRCPQEIHGYGARLAVHVFTAHAGKRPDMGDSSMIDASKYPGAELADTSDLAYKKAKMVWSSSQVRQTGPTKINALSNQELRFAGVTCPEI